MKTIIALLNLLFKGSVLHWLTALPPEVKSSFSNLKQRFYERYNPQTSKWETLKNIWTSKKGMYESVEDYFYRMSSLASAAEIDKDDYSYFGAVLGGLRDDIRRDIIIMQPKTIEDLYQAARLVEDNSSNKYDNEFADALMRIEDSINKLKTRQHNNSTTTNTDSDNHDINTRRSNRFNNHYDRTDKQPDTPRYKPDKSLSPYNRQPSPYTPNYTTTDRSSSSFNRQQPQHTSRHTSYRSPSPFHKRQSPHATSRNIFPRTQFRSDKTVHFANTPDNHSPHNQCNNCGNHHAPYQCPAKNKTCYSCHKLNHFARVCRSNNKR